MVHLCMNEQYMSVIRMGTYMTRDSGQLMQRKA